jgi:hypothetical protein
MALTLVRLRQVRKGDSLNDQLTGTQVSGIEASSVTQDDLQDGILSQLKRIIYGDGASNWNDDFIAGHVGTLQDLSNGRMMYANCLTSDIVGNLVRISGSDIGEVATVTKVDPSDNTKMPVIGMLIEKPTTTTCIIQTSGYIKLVSLGPLTVGKRYFVGLDGNVSMLPPLAISSPSNYAMIQIVGVARASTVLELNVDLNMTKVVL